MLFWLVFVNRPLAMRLLVPLEWHSGSALDVGGVEKHQQAHAEQHKPKHKAKEAHTM